VKNKQHLGFWLLLAMLAFFAGPLLRTGDAMLDYVEGEVRQTKLAMGETLGGWVVRLADGIFSLTPVMAMTQTVTKAKHTRAESDLSAMVAGPIGHASSKFYNSYLQGLILQAYILTMRLAILLFWLVFLLPMFGAAVWDGLMLRAIKRAEFGSIRPATFTLAGLVVIPMLSLPVLYLTMPFPLSPLLAPAWAALVAVPLSVLISNSQPLFGR
jgi:hypothetical protein